MPLKIAAGQFSSAGRKPVNQDFHGLCVPPPGQLATKGVAVALADGISSSEFAAQASQAAVTSFLADYYCTAESWSVKKSAERVLAAANSWLFAQTQQGQGRYDKDRGWACTFSAVVFKSRTAHLFHVGDARISQVQGRTLEPLTTDHRVHAGGGQSYLGRAFGIAPQVEIDHRTVPLAVGDTFVLATDGVHAFVAPEAIAARIATHAADLDAAARAIADAALAAGSDDNLTVQVLRVEDLPQAQASEVAQQAAELALPPLLEPGMRIDGYEVVRELHGSSRSHVHLALEEDTRERVVLKTPSIDLRDDAGYRERFLLEEWVARRMDSPHLLKAHAPQRPRTALYLAMEYVEGRTLAQWMVDHPRPGLDAVRDIVDQLGRGLRVMHRAEMLHQDLRPPNVLVDAAGTAKIIDFGAARVAGIVETEVDVRNPQPGTAQYMAPEYFLGEAGSARSDVFSLAVIAHQMLTGELPYGLEMGRCTTLAQQRRVRYRAIGQRRRDVPVWVDEAIRKALSPDPGQRYADVAEFVFALHHPDPALRSRARVPLVERDPVRFWKGLCLVLAVGWVVVFGLWWTGRGASLPAATPLSSPRPAATRPPGSLRP